MNDEATWQQYTAVRGRSHGEREANTAIECPGDGPG